MNEREQLKAAIEARAAAAEIRNRTQEALDRAGEYLRMVEDETTDLQVRNQAEIAKHGRSLIESFRAGALGTTLAETLTAAQLAEVERKYAAAGAAYAELERELAQACAAETAAEIAARVAAAAVFAAESSEIATQIRDAEKRAGDLREQLRAIDAVSSGVHPGEKLRFLSREAADALNWPLGDAHVSRAAHVENAATWRGHFDALLADANHLLRS